MKSPTIDELVAMDDAALSEVMGFTSKLAQAKEDLAKLATLKGEARKEAEDRVESMLTPNIYHSDLKYIYEDVTRRKSTGQEALADTRPASVL